MLLAANIAGPKLDGPAAQKWILAFGHLLKPVQQQAFANFLDIIQLVERQRARLHLQITFANRAPRFRGIVELLKSVPGIDEIWACIIAAEIGPFDRFPNADALEFWAGMTSDLKESAGRTQSGHITKAGSRSLRWALCKAALTLCRSDKKQEAIRQRLIRRIGKPKANVAMGRRLLRILYAMIRDDKPYARGPATKHNRARQPCPAWPANNERRSPDSFHESAYCGILVTPCGRGKTSAEGVPPRRRPRPAFIQPASRVRHSRNREAAWRRLRPCEFGPTDANKVLFSPEDTPRHCDRCVRRLRRDESNRRAAPLVRRRTGNSMPRPRARTQSEDGTQDDVVKTPTLALVRLRRADFRRHGTGVQWVEKRPLARQALPEAGCTLGAPLTWLSLGRLRPRRASRRFTRHFKRSTKSTTLPNAKREIPVDKRPLQR